MKVPESLYDVRLRLERTVPTSRKRLHLFFNATVALLMGIPLGLCWIVVYLIHHAA